MMELWVNDGVIEGVIDRLACYPLDRSEKIVYSQKCLYKEDQTVGRGGSSVHCLRIFEDHDIAIKIMMFATRLYHCQKIMTLSEDHDVEKDYSQERHNNIIMTILNRIHEAECLYKEGRFPLQVAVVLSSIISSKPS